MAGLVLKLEMQRPICTGLCVQSLDDAAIGIEGVPLARRIPASVVDRSTGLGFVSIRLDSGRGFGLLGRSLTIPQALTPELTNKISEASKPSCKNPTPRAEETRTITKTLPTPSTSF